MRKTLRTWLPSLTLLACLAALSGCTGEVSGDPTASAEQTDDEATQTDQYGPLPGRDPRASDVAPRGDGVSDPDASGGVVMPDPTEPSEAPSSEEPAAEEPAAEEPAAEEPAAETPPARTTPARTTPPAAEEPAAEEPAAEEPAEEPAAETPPPPAPARPAASPYPLPTLPSEIGIRWPAAPAITRTVNATTLAAAQAAAATAGTRVHVSGAIGGRLEIRANDVEIEFAPGASCDVVFIGKGLSRIAIRGGTIEHLETELPAEWNGSEMVWSRALLTTDVLIDGVTADADDTAFFLRAGIRIALVNSHGTAGRYSVWMGDTGDFESEHVIVAGNTFSSAGPEATFRLVHVVRSVTFDNRIENHGGIKHNYRIHGRSDLNWASGNVLVNSGVMLGTMATDSIGRQWFVDNEIFHTTPSLLEIQLDTANVTLRGNDIHSDVWTCLLCRDTPAGWTVVDNTMGPYVAPPAG